MSRRDSKLKPLLEKRAVAHLGALPLRRTHSSPFSAARGLSPPSRDNQQDVDSPPPASAWSPVSSLSPPGSVGASGEQPCRRRSVSVYPPSALKVKDDEGRRHSFSCPAPSSGSASPTPASPSPPATPLSVARLVGKLGGALARAVRAVPSRLQQRAWQAFQFVLDLSHDWMQERYQLVHLRRQMAKAATYQEWVTAAVKYDVILDRVSWTMRAESEHYDHTLIQRRLTMLRNLRRGHNAADIARSLRAGLHRNLGGISNPSLYNVTKVGTKVLIQDYINEVVDQLCYLSSQECASFPLMEKLVFFRETRHAFGRSALLLSGGATLTMYHLGPIKSLFEAGLLPRVISGSSGGALVAAWVCTATDDELLSRLEPSSVRMGPFEELNVGSLRRKFSRLCKRGVLFDIAVLERFVRQNIPDLTFLEAYRRTHRILNVTVTSTTASGDDGRLLNYLTAPNVLVYSAVLASCAIPGIYEPVELLEKNKHGNVVPYVSHGQHWCDGTIAHDLPTKRLAELFNINQFMVSQTNPWVVPFMPSTDEKVADMPWNLSGIWKRLWHLTGSNVRHVADNLVTLGLLPKRFARFVRLAAQRYRGDITIVPACGLGDYGRILSNPTAKYIKRCTLEGERRTWPKLSLIRARCAIEQALDTCVRKLQRELAQQSVPPLQALQPRRSSAEPTVMTPVAGDLHFTPHPVAIPKTVSPPGPMISPPTRVRRNPSESDLGRRKRTSSSSLADSLSRGMPSFPDFAAVVHNSAGAMDYSPTPGLFVPGNRGSLVSPLPSTVVEEPVGGAGVGLESDSEEDPLPRPTEEEVGLALLHTFADT